MAEYENSIIETQPTGPEDESGRNWLRLAGIILAAIIVSALLIFAARWVYSAITDNPEGTATVQTDDEDVLPADTRPESTANPQSNPGTTTPPATGGAQPGTQTPQTGNKLPNSGPEHVVALFAASTLAGAGAHYILTRRQNA